MKEVMSMEDRYLFKAKRIDNGEWVTGHYVKGLNMYDKEVHLIFEPNTMFYSSGETDGWYKVDPTTICQCTGLKDKNGKLIWENDIASYSDLITRDKKIICIEWNKMQASFVRKYRSPMPIIDVANITGKKYSDIYYLAVSGKVVSKRINII